VLVVMMICFSIVVDDGSYDDSYDASSYVQDFDA
jgi:hypothetical protein